MTVKEEGLRCKTVVGGACARADRVPCPSDERRDESAEVRGVMPGRSRSEGIHL